MTGEGVEGLKAAIAVKVHELREAARIEAESREEFEFVWEHRREVRDRRFEVIRLSSDVYRVVGPQVERMVVQTDWDNEEAISFLQHRLKKIGVDAALEAAGAVDGDEIRIVGRAFEFESVRTSEDMFSELDI